MSMNCPCGGPSKFSINTTLRKKPIKGNNIKSVSFNECCAKYLDMGNRATDAEALMRSRYSAYVLGRVNYLNATWHKRTKPDQLSLENEVKWLGLEVKCFTQSQSNLAEVEFVARYKIDGKAYRLHERSRFQQEKLENSDPALKADEMAWFYVDGDIFY